MNQIRLLSFFIAIASVTKGQDIRVPMQARYWDYDSSRVEFIQHRDVPAAKGKNGAYYQIFLKDRSFDNGAIEFVRRYSAVDNGQFLYAGKNYFGTPEQKNDGRCTIDNSHFSLPLKEGKNEILIGLANYFYGWGIIARLDKIDGIRFQ